MAAQQQVVRVKVPQGATVGSTVQATLPNGQQVKVQLPPGVVGLWRRRRGARLGAGCDGPRVRGVAWLRGINSTRRQFNSRERATY